MLVEIKYGLCVFEYRMLGKTLENSLLVRIFENSLL
jgi:hypothetical protein